MAFFFYKRINYLQKNILECGMIKLGYLCLNLFSLFLFNSYLTDLNYSQDTLMNVHILILIIVEMQPAQIKMVLLF